MELILLLFYKMNVYKDSESWIFNGITVKYTLSSPVLPLVVNHLISRTLYPRPLIGYSFYCTSQDLSKILLPMTKLNTSSHSCLGDFGSK